MKIINLKYLNLESEYTEIELKLEQLIKEKNFSSGLLYINNLKISKSDKEKILKSFKTYSYCC